MGLPIPTVVRRAIYVHTRAACACHHLPACLHILYFIAPCATFTAHYPAFSEAGHLAGQVWIQEKALFCLLWSILSCGCTGFHTPCARLPHAHAHLCHTRTRTHTHCPTPYCAPLPHTGPRTLHTTPTHTFTRVHTYPAPCSTALYGAKAVSVPLYYTAHHHTRALHTRAHLHAHPHALPPHTHRSPVISAPAAISILPPWSPPGSNAHCWTSPCVATCLPTTSPTS